LSTLNPSKIEGFKAAPGPSPGVSCRPFNLAWEKNGRKPAGFPAFFKTTRNAQGIKNDFYQRMDYNFSNLTKGTIHGLF
jgi:hypothetical protein